MGVHFHVQHDYRWKTKLSRVTGQHMCKLKHFREAVLATSCVRTYFPGLGEAVLATSPFQTYFNGFAPAPPLARKPTITGLGGFA